MATLASHPIGGHLPTPLQQLLLQIIIGPEDQALGRWQQWQSQLDLDDIDHGSFRLLPMLHHTLRRLRADGADLSRYHGVARKAWYENKLIFHRIEKLITQWQVEHREIAVLKGVALAHMVYPDPALRPMDDADVLVPQAEAIMAIDWFFANGWTNLYDKARETIVKYSVRKEHSADMRHPSGLAIDVHWQILNFPLPPLLVQEIWDAKQSVTIGQVVTHTLCPTDHLLHVCAHGIAWNTVPPLRWIMDAHFLLQRFGPQIDWERLIRLSKEMHVAHFVSTALNYLVVEFDEPIPADVLTRINRIPRLPWHKLEFDALISPDPLQLRDYSLRYRYLRLCATLPEWQVKPKWKAQLDYLKLHWELDSNIQLLGRIGARLGQKLWYWLRRLRG
jgi:hypothetical protein